VKTLMQTIRNLRARLRRGPAATLLVRRKVYRIRPLPGLDFRVALDADGADAAWRCVLNGNAAGLELMRHLVRPGDRVIDLGSNVGMYALTAAALGCEVLAVEASPLHADLIRTSARLNGFADLHVANCAVGAAHGFTAFCEDGAFGSVAAAGVARSVTAWTPVLDVDTLLAGLGWDRVAFVKMDVEGSEIAALAGMKGLLHGPDAPPVLFESNDHTLHFFGHTAEGLHGAFAAGGYQCLQVGDRRLTACPPGAIQGPTCVDYLAVKGPVSPPPGWQMSPSLTDDELIHQFCADLEADNADLRASAALRLARVGERLREAPRLRVALQRLHQDPDARVREAASLHTSLAA